MATDRQHLSHELRSDLAFLLISFQRPQFLVALREQDQLSLVFLKTLSVDERRLDGFVAATYINSDANSASERSV